MAAGFTAVLMGVLAVTALAWAGLHVWIGGALMQHSPRSRLLALGLAIGNLPLLPFGTALGAYACWVLLNDEGRQVFDADRRPWMLAYRRHAPARRRIDACPTASTVRTAARRRSASPPPRTSAVAADAGFGVVAAGRARSGTPRRTRRRRGDSVA